MSVRFVVVVFKMPGRSSCEASKPYQYCCKQHRQTHAKQTRGVSVPSLFSRIKEADTGTSPSPPFSVKRGRPRSKELHNY